MKNKTINKTAKTAWLSAVFAVAISAGAGNASAQGIVVIDPMNPESRNRSMAENYAVFVKTSKDCFADVKAEPGLTSQSRGLRDAVTRKLDRAYYKCFSRKAYKQGLSITDVFGTVEALTKAGVAADIRAEKTGRPPKYPSLSQMRKM